MDPRRRERFDELLQEEIDDLPDAIRELLEEMPVVVEDRPSPQLLRSLSEEAGEEIGPDELCGLHTGHAFTEGIPDGLPSEIMLFREGIVAEAGGWELSPEDPPDLTIEDIEEAIREEIRTTLLHEVGHQFGLSEEDLARLGYD